MSKSNQPSDQLREAIHKAAELIANCYCDDSDTFYGEVARLTKGIAGVVDQPTPGDTIPANRRIQLQLIREKVADGYEQVSRANCAEAAKLMLMDIHYLLSLPNLGAPAQPAEYVRGLEDAAKVAENYGKGVVFTAANAGVVLATKQNITAAIRRLIPVTPAGPDHYEYDCLDCGRLLIYNDGGVPTYMCQPCKKMWPANNIADFAVPHRPAAPDSPKCLCGMDTNPAMSPRMDVVCPKHDSPDTQPVEGK